jgi:hypothetical protein
LLSWPPENYKLRVAEWGVWINDGGKLKLMQSVLDEIPPFVHRTGNPIGDFKDRINQIWMVTKRAWIACRCRVNDGMERGRGQVC